MKLTTAAILAFACASAMANFVPYEESAIYARDLHERNGGESFLESFEKRKPRGRSPSLSHSFASAAGVIGGSFASKLAQLAIQQRLAPQTPQVPQQQRRSLDARVRRRRLPNSGSYASYLVPMRKKGKGIATAFLDGFTQGVAARGLEEDVLDELD